MMTIMVRMMMVMVMMMMMMVIYLQELLTWVPRCEGRLQRQGQERE